MMFSVSGSIIEIYFLKRRRKKNPKTTGYYVSLVINDSDTVSDNIRSLILPSVSDG